MLTSVDTSPTLTYMEATEREAQIRAALAALDAAFAPMEAQIRAGILPPLAEDDDECSLRPPPSPEGRPVTRQTAVRVGASPVQHFSGARPTFVTYQGVAEMSDGSRVKCPHQGHRTTAAAAACAQRSAR